jgi:hypothetical protein
MSLLVTQPGKKRDGRHVGARASLVQKQFVCSYR